MWEIIFSALQSIGVIASILFAVRQISRARVVSERDSYERLSREYQALLWQTMEHRHLDRVWEPLTDEDRERLDTAVMSGNLWGVGYSMSADEKDCYRFTRAALEVLERAWQLHRFRHIDNETWQKWSQWIETWSKSSYFQYVFRESRNQLSDGYAKWIDEHIIPVTARAD